MGKRIRICHMTDKHYRYDTRIFEKECKSLSKNYDVILVVSDDMPNEVNNEVVICSTGYKASSRLNRLLKSSWLTYKLALEQDCQIYHIHDPEMLLYALKLKANGKVVIFDSHEDTSAQIMDKYWIPIPFRRLLSYIYKKFENYVVRNIDGVITATPHIARCLYNNRVEVINNYPKLDDIIFQTTPFIERQRNIAYIGGISELRGEKTMCSAMDGLDAKLVLAGPRDDSSSKIESNNVEYVGVLNREEINNLFGNSRMGLVLLEPTANYREAQPIKMYEYMAAGLPFVCSNFKLWEDFVSETKSGICVDPHNVEKIRATVLFLLENPSISQEMGANGRRAIEDRYSWTNEEIKLLSFYDAICDGHTIKH